MSQLLERLQALLATVRVELANGGTTLVHENRTTPIRSPLPFDGFEPGAEAGELMAMAAALEAAVKAPAKVVVGEDLRTGAAALLPKLERRRFVDTYHCVRADASERLLHRDFGGGLVVCFVEDQGWRFQHMSESRFQSWQTSLETVHSAGRSNLYHKAPLDWQAVEVALGDGYDAARAVLLDDVFYDRMRADGIMFAVPGRDLLMVASAGGNLDATAVRHAYATARYPLSPERFRFRDHQARRADPA